MKKHNSGFSLIEVTLALGIAAFSLVSILGVIPVGLNTSAGAKRQTEAVSIISSIAADLRSITTSATPSSRYGIKVGTAGSNSFYFTESGAMCGSPTGAIYCATVTANPPSTRDATWVQLRVAWPANSNATNSQGAVETAVSVACN